MSLLRSLIAALALRRAEPGGLAAEGSIVALTVAEGEHGGGRTHVQARFGNAHGPMRLDTGASSTRLRAAPWNAEFPLVGEQPVGVGLGRGSRDARTSRRRMCSSSPSRGIISDGRNMS